MEKISDPCTENGANEDLITVVTLSTNLPPVMAWPLGRMGEMEVWGRGRGGQRVKTVLPTAAKQWTRLILKNTHSNTLAL